MFDFFTSCGGIIQVMSFVLLVGAVTTYFVKKRRRKRRDAECAARTRPQDVEPLCDDVAEKVSPRRFKWLNLCDNHYSALVESLQSQLSRRPDVWGAGLWPDAETEEIARTCADLLKPYGIQNARLIPGDPLALIAASCDEGVKPLVGDIEEKFQFVIEDAWYASEHTFAELVEYVRTHRGTAPRSVFRERRRTTWLGVTVLWIIFVGLVWWAVSSVSSLCQSIADGDLCVKPMLNAVIAVPLALFAVYIAYIMIAQWFADRREEKEERKNTSRKE